MGYITGISGDAFPYDERIFGYDWDPTEDMITDCFQSSGQREQIWEAIHVADSTKEPKFEMGSSAVGAAFSLDTLIDYSWYFEELIKMEQPVLIYAGEFDAQDGPATQEPWMRRLVFENRDEFWEQSRQVYWVEDPYSDHLIVGGYWREREYFSYLTVPKAGHFVPNNYYQPSFSFFKDYIAG